MSIKRTFIMVFKDLRMGPRSPVFLFALLMPVLITFLMQVVFATLLDPEPRLGIADLGQSEITTAVQEMEGIDLTLARSATELRELVENNDVDAGLVLDEGFDNAVRAGERPELRLFISGESLVTNRIILAVTAIDLVREVEGRAAPVEVVLKSLGDGKALPISQLITLFIVIFVLLVAGIFVPAFMLVSERERGTLHAVLVTPVKMPEVLLARALLGFIMAIPMAYLTLALNGVLTVKPLALLATLAVAALICIEIGLIYGTVAKDAKTLFTFIKTLNIFILGPAIFYFFPDWPQWIAKIFPTYWFIDPLYQIGLRGASLPDVWIDLAIALGIGALMVVPIVLLGRRMQVKLATA